VVPTAPVNSARLEIFSQEDRKRRKGEKKTNHLGFALPPAGLFARVRAKGAANKKILASDLPIFL
jgi:hypothetical protein